MFEKSTFLIIAHAQRADHRDVHRFEKISNIIKQFKLSCIKLAAQFTVSFFLTFLKIKYIALSTPIYYFYQPYVLGYQFLKVWFTTIQTSKIFNIWHLLKLYHETQSWHGLIPITLNIFEFFELSQHTVYDKSDHCFPGQNRIWVKF